jgi:PKD repeat protein
VVADLEEQDRDGMYRWESERQRVVKCDNSRFMNMKEVTKKLGITDIYWCPEKNFSYKLTGGYSSYRAQFITFEIDYCT